MGKGKGKGTGSGYRSPDNRNTLEKITVPAMPMPMAICCCVINFILPGFGTIVAGFTLFCCGRNEGLDSGSKVGGCCICFGLGIAQLLVAVLFFPCGWAWSIMWGIYMIGISAQYYNINDPNRPPSRVAVVYPAQPGYSAQPMPNQQGYAYGYVQQPGTHVQAEQAGVKVNVNVVSGNNPPPPQTMPPQTMPAPPQYTDVAPPPPTYAEYTASNS